jgi:hypothetical protein
MYGRGFDEPGCSDGNAIWIVKRGRKERRRSQVVRVL